MVIDGYKYTNFSGINLKEGVLRFGAVLSDAMSASGTMAMYVRGTTLYFWNGASETAIGAAGAGGVTTWDELYDSDKTLDVDSSTFTLNGTAALGTGAVLTIANAGTGNDITGPAWSIISTGSVGILELASGGTINATDGALTIGKAATATTIAGTMTVTQALTATASITITGTADSTCLTVTAGDVSIANGKIVQANDDTDTALAITADSVTTGNVIDINADGLTSGTILHLDSTVAGVTTGLYIDCFDGAASDFSVGIYGTTTIAGNAATNVFNITAGDAVMSDGSLTMADADDAATLSVTSTAVFTQTGSGVVTIIADSATTGNIIDVNADGLTNGTILHLDSTTAGWGTGKYIDCFDGAASEFSVGLDGATIITTSAAGTIGLTINSASTTGDSMNITATGLTTGDGIQIAQTGEAFAAGELLKITNTEDGNISATPKTGNLCSITSSVTATTADTTLNYDGLLISRSNISNNAGFTLTASGSALKLMVTSTNTAGTCTDSTVGLEIVMADGGTAAPTGTAVDIISVGVGAKALNIASASTSVSDVLITGSGAKANNKGVLEITSTGATAAGGSLLRVATTSGTPAAATSYLVDFDYSAATMTNNPVAVIINAGSSTAAGLQVTGSGASAGGLVELNSTATGALGAVLKFDQTANSAANSDVSGRILFTAQDDANAAENYARIDCIIRDVTAANPDASLNFLIDRAGIVTLALTVGWDTVASAALNGILVGDGAATGIVSSQGAYDLTLETNGGTNSGTITITDAANGDITITPNGIGQTLLYAPTWTVTSKDAGATLTVAEGGVILANTGVAGITLVLPAAATSTGLWYSFVKTNADATALTIDGNGAELINGSATHATCDAQYDTVTIVCDGTGWYIVAKAIA